MSNVDSIIAVAGWEDRFVRGLQQDIEFYRPSRLLVFVFDEYRTDTERQRLDIWRFAEERDVRYTEVPVRRDPVQLWTAIRKMFSGSQWSETSVLVDITTMPREVIWWTFSFLRSAKSQVSYVYYRPENYAAGWLTRDTERPRLVYQHSGISDFGKQTCLLLLSGFDTDRAAQMIQFFEPRSILIGQQTGDQYDNNVKHLEQNRRLQRTKNVKLFDVDAYSPDHGLGAIENVVKETLAAFNVVAASLGPKPSAVALYKLHLKHPEIALAYAPSRQFHPQYSVGIGEAIRGVISELSYK